MCGRKREKKREREEERGGEERGGEERGWEESLESCLSATYSVIGRKLSRIEENQINPFPPRWNQIMLFQFAKIM